MPPDWHVSLTGVSGEKTRERPKEATFHAKHSYYYGCIVRFFRHRACHRVETTECKGESLMAKCRVPGSFRCQKRFHNSLIPTNLRDKLGGVESVNGAPRTWNPVAGSFFTSPPASFTAGILPLCKNIEVRLQVCVFQFGCVCVSVWWASVFLAIPTALIRTLPPPCSDSRKFD
ncbi:hypothetical protein DPX16_13794 [Anabarilius grahami]|uniref:Uncharacterized protein n=1 Tax=Anabarilius grahami TaxID=495550 RepID=A0A3N0XS51_ANAGA|nr:hypothetical protein DPX16_13794 [Anabarilius grahami]